jgi:hypothetical protein
VEKIDISDTLNTLYSYNMRLIDSLDYIVSEFRGQREANALRQLVDALEGLEWSINISILIGDVFAQYGLCIDKEHITGVLKDMVGAMGNSDYVLLPDLLEYELIDLLKECQETLQMILNDKY